MSITEGVAGAGVRALVGEHQAIHVVRQHVGRKGRADLVVAFVGLLLGYLLLLHFAPVVLDGNLTEKRKSEARWLLAITLAQGAIGYIQYFTGVPEVLVMAHLFGVVILWSALIRHAIRVRAFHR